MLEVFESESLDCCTSTTLFRIPSAPCRPLDGRPASSPFVTLSTARTHPGRSNRSYLPIYKILHRARATGHRISRYLLNPNHKEVDIKRPIEVMPICELRSLQPHCRQRSCRPWAPNGERILHAPVEFPPVKRLTDTIEISPLSAKMPAKLVSFVTARPRAAEYLVPEKTSEGSFLPRQTGQRLRKTRRCRSFSASLSARILRLAALESHGLRSPVSPQMSGRARVVEH